MKLVREKTADYEFSYTPRRRPPVVWLTVCRTNGIHDLGNHATEEGAKRGLKVVDLWPCGPHRIVKYKPCKEGGP